MTDVDQQTHHLINIHCKEEEEEKNKIYYHIVDHNFICSDVSTRFYIIFPWWWTEWDDLYEFILEDTKSM